jgi:hypothetical protein
MAKLADYHILCVDCEVELAEQQTQNGVELFCPSCQTALVILKPVEYDEHDMRQEVLEAVDRYNETRTMKCSRCRGSGKIHKSDDSYSMFTVPCYDCLGTGATT